MQFQQFLQHNKYSSCNLKNLMSNLQCNCTCTVCLALAYHCLAVFSLQYKVCIAFQCFPCNAKFNCTTSQCRACPQWLHTDTPCALQCNCSTSSVYSSSTYLQCALQCRVCRSAAAGPSKSGRPGRGLRPRHHHTAAQLA